MILKRVFANIVFRKILFDYMVKTEVFKFEYTKMSLFPSDAKCHILHCYSTNKFSEDNSLLNV